MTRQIIRKRNLRPTSLVESRKLTYYDNFGRILGIHRPLAVNQSFLTPRQTTAHRTDIVKRLKCVRASETHMFWSEIHDQKKISRYVRPYVEL